MEKLNDLAGKTLTGYIAIKNMKVKDNSIQVTPYLMVKKTGRNEYRLGEIGGDWIMSGTADEVMTRVYLDNKVREIGAALIRDHGLNKYQAAEMVMDIMRKAAGMQTKHCLPFSFKVY